MTQTDNVVNLRQAHAVIRQRVRLTYAPPELVLIAAPVILPGAPPVSLQTARMNTGLTIVGLAKRSGISPATIYRIEHGKTRPRPHAVHALCTALARQSHEILEFVGIIPTPGRL